MTKSIILLIIASILLSACVDGPGTYFKRSANGKFFDRKGFQGGKRAPLYNKKYVAMAKKNIREQDIDDDDDEDDEFYDEAQNISRANQEMYQEMINDERRQRQNNTPKNNKYSNNKDPYPSLIDSSRSTYGQNNSDTAALKAELERIRAMLEETSKEFSNLKCPSAKSLETIDNPSAKQNASPNKAYNKDNKGQDNRPKAGVDNENITDPVHNI